MYKEAVFSQLFAFSLWKKPASEGSGAASSGHPPTFNLEASSSSSCLNPSRSNPEVVGEEDLTRGSVDYCSGVAAWDQPPVMEHSGGSGRAPLVPTISDNVERPKPKLLSGKQRADMFQVKYDRTGIPDPIPQSRAYNGFTLSHQAWPTPLPGSTPQRPLFYPKQMTFKYGGCPEHSDRSLVPKVCGDSVREWAGTIRLFCTAVHEFTSTGWRKCLCSFPFDVQYMKQLPLTIQSEYASLQASLNRGRK